MLNSFFAGFFESLAWIFTISMFALVITITCAPVILAYMCSNVLWLLLYFIIIPVDCGLWNAFF